MADRKHNPHQYYDVVTRPLMTEKSTVLQDIRNHYTFRVNSKANKPEVKKAIEALFDVHVEKVRIINMPGKVRRVLGRPGERPGWKKAVVTLREGETIDLA